MESNTVKNIPSAKKNSNVVDNTVEAKTVLDTVEVKTVIDNTVEAKTIPSSVDKKQINDKITINNIKISFEFQEKLSEQEKKNLYQKYKIGKNFISLPITNHQEMLDHWYNTYNIKDKIEQINSPITGFIKNNESCKIFFLYFLKKDDEIDYIELEISFDDIVDFSLIENNVNEIFYFYLN